MSQERLNGLAVLSIESDAAMHIDYKNIVKTFANANVRKVSIF